MKKTILIYYETRCSNAPRLYKQLDALHENFNLKIASTEFVYDRTKYQDIQYIQLPITKNKEITFHLEYPPLIRKVISFFIKIYLKIHYAHLQFDLSNKMEKFFWNRHFFKHYQILKQHEFDLIIGHHVNSLIICSKLKKQKQVPFIFNAHEFYPEQSSENAEWVKKRKSSIDYMFKKYSQNIDEVFSVGDNIGKKYLDQFEISKYTLVPNDKKMFQLEPSKIEGKIKLIHHGAASPARKIEDLIQLMDYLPEDNYELNLMLVAADIDYYNDLKELSKSYKNINLLEPVPLNEIIPFTNQFDLGVYILHPHNFNHLNALPNKFFEFIQARLCICLSPNPEMKYLIDKYDLGVTSNQYSSESLAEAILGLDVDDILLHKKNSHKAAQILNSENTKASIYKRIKYWLDN